MNYVAALIYWVIVALWVTVLCSVAYSYIRNPRAFGTTRLLLTVIAIDACRNIVENVYFGLYFGGQYGVFPGWTVAVLGQPALLIVPKLLNIAAGCLVLGLLLYRWLPLAVREWDEAEQRVDDLETLTAIDPVTGAYNSRQFEPLARAEFDRCQRYMRPLSLLLIDVDRFSMVNERFGSEIGDWTLKMVAMTIASAKRDSDVFARLGGEKFALLLPETTKEAARAFAERLRASFRANPLSISGQQLGLTLSIGVADAGVRTSGIETLMRNAQQALEAAKRDGQDRVSVTMPIFERLASAAE